MDTFLKKLQQLQLPLRTVNLLCLIMLLLAIIILALRVLGYNFFAVQTGSMAEIYPIGSIIIVKPTDFNQIQINDVISYYINDNTIITHRVVSINIDKQSFITKGDENNSLDSASVYFHNVIGKPIFSIKYLGYLYLFAHTTKGKFVLVGLLILTMIVCFYPYSSRKGLKENEKGKD